MLNLSPGVATITWQDSSTSSLSINEPENVVVPNEEE